jgi:quinol monooxygenase YgiN
MVRVGLFVRIEAFPGREQDVENLLTAGLPLVQAEPATAAWFALRLGERTFGIFDAFADDAGRDAHLTGEVAAALAEYTGQLFPAPLIEKVDVLAAKMP